MIAMFIVINLNWFVFLLTVVDLVWISTYVYGVVYAGGGGGGPSFIILSMPVW